MKQDAVTLEGTVTDVSRGLYQVQCDIVREVDGAIAKHMVRARLSGSMGHVHRIKVVVGDRVRVEVSPMDLSQGRIVWRYREVP